ncbi:unnamed protein product, partial [Meganyctiphanes norvegica]
NLSELYTTVLPRCSPFFSQVQGLRMARPSSIPAQPQQVIMENTAEDDERFANGIIGKVNDQISQNNHGRLFAIVHLAGKQHRVSAEDLIVIQGNWYPNIGDVIRCEKVMCVGGRDFTLYGRPLLHRDLVNIEATVIEKTLSHTIIDFYNRRRKNSRRTRFYRIPYTTLRINHVDIMHKIDELPEVGGVDGRIF